MILRSVGAAVAGVGVNLLAIPVEVALMAAGLFAASDANTGEAECLLALAYRSAFAVLAAWVTARLGVLLASAGAAGQWHLGHHSYPLSLVAVSLSASGAGARLSTRSTT